MEAWENEYPSADEYVNCYASYVELTTRRNVIHQLNEQMHDVFTLINSIPGPKALIPYAPGKWTLKELVGHLIETERVFSYRALAISRGDQQPLPGMDQDAYIAGNNYNERTLANLANEFLAVRVSTVHLFSSMTSEMIAREGVASGFGVTVRALAFMIAGHTYHHIQQINEKYL